MIYKSVRRWIPGPRSIFLSNTPLPPPSGSCLDITTFPSGVSFFIILLTFLYVASLSHIAPATMCVSV